MSTGLIPTDRYEFQARVLPMGIVLTPLVCAILPWFPGQAEWLELLGGSAGLLMFAAVSRQVARDAGKKREPFLFAEWGGKPSVQALSYAKHAFDETTIRRVHERLETIDSSLEFPAGPEQELEMPGEAAKTYASANEILLAKTRSGDRFRLVFAENINYGFRRNLWAMRPTGIILAVMGTAACASRISLDLNGGQAIEPVPGLGLLVCATLLALWLVRFRKPWVRVAADEYAKQLIRASQLTE